MRLDLETPSQSLIELGACFVAWCMPLPKKMGWESCGFQSLLSTVLWKWEEANSFSPYVTDLKCQ